MTQLPWRSLLFVPAISDRFVESAPRRGADALILDLEDSIAPSLKQEARDALSRQVPRLVAQGMIVLVRVNSGAQMGADLRAAARPGVTAIMVPKVESAAMLAQAIQLLDVAERGVGLPPGAIGLVALIEGPHAVLEARSIASVGGRLIGLGFGAEDFAAAMGVRPTPLALTWPAQMIAMAARGAGLQAIGLPGGIAAIDDLTEFRQLAATARAIGMTGSVCIHPAQVPVLNAAFSPSPEELDWAEAVIDGFEKALADGGAAIAVRGRMVDRPVYDQALALRAAARIS